MSGIELIYKEKEMTGKIVEAGKAPGFFPVGTFLYSMTFSCRRFYYLNRAILFDGGT